MLDAIGAIHFDDSAVADLSALIARYRPAEFESPYRSTIPLLALLRDGQSTLRHILIKCNMSAPVSLHLESRVASPRGRGTPSHTDLLALSDKASLAVEVKWSEPRYDTVSTWLNRDAASKGPPTAVYRDCPENRTEVLEGWNELLAPHVRRTVGLSDYADAIYQMVHRAASACAWQRSPQLAYMRFTPLPNGEQPDFDQLWSDLVHLHRLLGSPSDFPFHLIEVQVKATPSFEKLRNLQKGLPTTAQWVRQGLLSDRLFEFGHPQIRTLRGS